MRRLGRTVVLAGAGLALALAAGLGLLALDARSWRDTLRDDDVRFQMAPARTAWDVDERVPFRLARRALAVEDDVELRRALRAFQLARTPGTGFEAAEQRAAIRARAQIALAFVERDAGDARRRALAANLLGLLAFDEAINDPRNSAELLRRTIADFRRAIAYDAQYEEAKFNLELTLRLSRPEAQERRERVGIFGAGESVGAGAGLPGRGY